MIQGINVNHVGEYGIHTGMFGTKERCLRTDLQLPVIYFRHLRISPLTFHNCADRRTNNENRPEHYKCISDKNREEREGR